MSQAAQFDYQLKFEDAAEDQYEAAVVVTAKLMQNGKVEIYEWETTKIIHDGRECQITEYRSELIEREFQRHESEVLQAAQHQVSIKSSSRTSRYSPFPGRE